ncbi:MAG: glycosyltransferase [Verrucomicrobiota bacterium]
MRPEISVCMPVYNGRQFVRRAVASVLAQDFSGFELVIGDDGSTDGTQEICESLHDPRIRIERFATNVGLARNWNRTIQACRGKYVKFLAQDDLLMPNAFQIFNYHRKLYPEGRFYFCANEQIDEYDGHLRFRRPPFRRPVLNSEELVRDLFIHGNIVGGPSNTLIHADAFASTGWFDDRSVFALDWIMWIQLAQRFGGVYVDTPLVRIREHSKSETSRLSAGMAGVVDGYRALQILEEREPALRSWVRLAKRACWKALPKIAVKHAVQTRNFPTEALDLALHMWKER